MLLAAVVLQATDNRVALQGFHLGQLGAKRRQPAECGYMADRFAAASSGQPRAPSCAPATRSSNRTYVHRLASIGRYVPVSWESSKVHCQEKHVWRHCGEDATICMPWT